MKRTKEGFIFKKMPGRGVIEVFPMRGQHSLDFGNLEAMDDDAAMGERFLSELCQVHEWGPYYTQTMKDDEGEPAWDWAKLLSEDMACLIAGITAATYGPVKSVDIRCSSKCHPIFGRWTERVCFQDLEITQYPLDVLNDLANKDNLRMTDILGYEIKYSLVADTSRAVEVSKGAGEMERYASTLPQTVRHVDLEDVGDDPAAIRAWSLELVHLELQELSKEMVKVIGEAGIQKIHRCSCPNPECGEVHILELPFGRFATSPWYVEGRINLRYIRELRRFPGFCLFEALKNCEKSCRKFADQGKATRSA